MIRTEGLTKQFGDALAVDRLNLEIERGEFFCFLGPNGAGKTTTIKMLTGLIKPTRGRALLGESDIQEDPVGTKQRLGYIPDHPFLYEKLTGREFMELVGGLYRIEPDVIVKRGEELREQFGIAHVADQLTEHYSHGMRQKLSFASCFLHAPDIVIVDEPWVGLDPQNIRFVKNFLKERTRDGLTVFMSTHTLSIAEEIADRIGIINKGTLLRTGTVSEVKDLADNPGSLEDVFLDLTQGSDA
jgi:ABC-2 type transport system ATP-binding protein